MKRKGVTAVSKRPSPPPEPGRYVKPDRPRTPRIALVGFCQGSRDLTPYGDTDLTIVGLNKGYIFQPRIDDYYEMHGPDIYRWEIRRPNKHLDWMRAFPGRIFMHRHDPDIPNSIEYPLAEVAETIGAGLTRVAEGGKAEPGTLAPYLTSSIAYQIALAIHEGYRQIELYGIDLNTGGEYAWQKPGVEYLIGVALGRGIRVVLPSNCPLLQGKLYGRGFMKPEGEAMSRSQYEVRLEELKQRHQQLSIQAAQLEGAEAVAKQVTTEMFPGIDMEIADQRHRQYQGQLAQVRAELKKTEGAINETAYWISFTPDGQEPRQAIEQLNGRALVEQAAEPEPLEAVA
jgi:hypothetical protein